MKTTKDNSVILAKKLNLASVGRDRAELRPQSTRGLAGRVLRKENQPSALLLAKNGVRVENINLSSSPGD